MSGGFFMTNIENQKPIHGPIESKHIPISELKRDPIIGHSTLDIVWNTETNHPSILDLQEKIRQTSLQNPEQNPRTVLLQALSKTLLEINLSELNHISRESLIPYKSNGEDRQTLVVSSASSASGSRKAELGLDHPIDIPAAIEGRDTLTAKGKDVALIHTTSGLVMSQGGKGAETIINLAQEEILELQGSDIYYKADALLLLILTNPESQVLRRLVETIKENPVIYPYNLDEETQIALLWLKNKAQVDKLDVSANSPETGIELTRKGFWYPTIDEALKVDYYPDPYEMQKQEWQLSQSAKEINYHPDSVPGYVVKRGEKEDLFKENVLKSLMLHATRYEFEDVWVKPDRGTDGGNQGAIYIDSLDQNTIRTITQMIQNNQAEEALALFLSSLSQENKTSIDRNIEAMWETKSDWVIQAYTHYFTGEFGHTNPSIHVINGEVQETVSHQIMDGKMWGGNAILSYQDWASLINTLNKDDPRISNESNILPSLYLSYHTMIDDLKGYLRAVNNSERYKNGLVRGGVDIALCTLGGKFNHEQLVIAFQDSNIRANGCETARALYKKAQKDYGSEGKAVTRNFSPRKNYTEISSLLPAVVDTVNQKHQKQLSLDQVHLIAVSSGWGQIGLIGVNALEVMENVFLIQEELRAMEAIT